MLYEIIGTLFFGTILLGFSALTFIILAFVFSTVLWIPFFIVGIILVFGFMGIYSEFWSTTY